MNRDDELLAAYIDGHLTTEEAAALDRRLAEDSGLAARLAHWSANDRLIQAAFVPLADEPIPQELLARIGLGDSAPTLAAANDNPPWWRRFAVPLGGALAASLAFALTFGSPTADPLSAALDTTPSLARATLADGRVIEPILTMRASDGRWCREYREGEVLALACRGQDGWTVEGSARSDEPADRGDYALAGEAGANGLDALHRRLGTSAPLGTAEERAVIATGWQRPQANRLN